MMVVSLGRQGGLRYGSMGLGGVCNWFRGIAVVVAFKAAWAMNSNKVAGWRIQQK